MHKCFLSLAIPKREMEAIENIIEGMKKDHNPIYATLKEQLGTQIQAFTDADYYLPRILQRNGIATFATIHQSVPAHYFPNCCQLQQYHPMLQSASAKMNCQRAKKGK